MIPEEKIIQHIDAIFGKGISPILPSNLCVIFSKRTGKIRSFGTSENIIGTIRSDGGIALTIYGARTLIRSSNFKENCMVPVPEAVPFVCEGRSLFCKHVKWFGSNINVGSEVVIVDEINSVVAVGRSIVSQSLLKRNYGGVAVKVREGIKSRSEEDQS